VSCPDDHATFYRRSLMQAIGDGHDEILISGAADEVMLRHVVDALPLSARGIRVTVVDVCAAPLDRCRRFATEVGAQVETIRCDLTAWSPRRRFDVIVTDSFLTRFAPVDRSAVFAAWRRLLRSGGCVVTTAGVNESNSNGRPIRMNRADAQRFVELAAEAASHDLPRETRAREHQLAAVREFASMYSRQLRTYPFRTVGDVTRAFTDAGFSVMHSEAAMAPREFIFTGMSRILAEC